MGLLGAILNLLGAIARWTWGSCWRTLMSRKKFKFSEYVYGPENTNDWFDQKGHSFVNRVVGFIVILVIVVILNKVSVLF